LPEILPMLELAFVVASPVVVVGIVAYLINEANIRHRERMAKIEHGIDPDAENKAR